ncbi:DUF3168 domain-containing protein [Methanosalsum natronophilum]|uniref:DUF3168 domain-containing protein n=1 Tax=Methanosalsum natronophilum TaxID=768733 RepID=A0A3R7VXR2_9EURY|nr:MAG: DUF3168 domain-containing protein [Methanosalsum natronophilum]
MTSIHVSIRTLLLQDPLIDEMVDERIYPHKLPLNCELPAISIHKISYPIHHITNTATPRYQVSCWTRSYSQAQELSETVIECLNRFKGTASGNPIKQVVYLGSEDVYEDMTEIFHVPIDFKVIHMR